MQLSVTIKSRSLRTTRTSTRHPGNKLTSPTIEVKSCCNWLGLGLLGSGFREVKWHLHGGLINQCRANILLKNFLLPRMARLSTTVTLPNGNRIALRGGHPSVHVLGQLLTGRGYSVEVHLFPNNVLSSVPAVDRPFFFSRRAPHGSRTGKCYGRFILCLRVGRVFDVGVWLFQQQL